MNPKPRTALILQALTFLALLSVVWAGLLLPAMAMATVVKIDPAQSTVEVGQTVVVNVTIEGVNDLYGVEFHLQFDPTYLEVVDADEGTNGVQIGDGTLLNADFTAQNQVNNATGAIDYAISQMSPSQSASGSGPVAVITFRGKALGTAGVTINEALLSDSSGFQISATTQNGAVTVGGVEEPTATPAPPTATDTATPAEPTPTATPTATGPTPTTPPATATPTPGAPTPTATGTPPETPAPTPTGAPAACEIQGYHVVQRGETIYAVGRAYAARPARIIACNQLLNPSLIHAGLNLAVPLAPWIPVPPGPTARRQFTPSCGPCPPVQPCRYYHTVRRYDTLTSIAWRYRSSVWSIAWANGLYNVNLIYPGQVLCIP